MKKLSVLFTIIVISIMSFASVSIAAKPVDAKDIIQKLKSSQVLKVYVSQAESYLYSRTITTQEAEQILALLDEVLAIVGKNGKLSDLTSRQKLAILELFTEAGEVLDLEVVYDDGDIKITDKDGRVVFHVVYPSTADIIRHTGYDYNIALYGLSFLLLAGIAGVTTRKVLVKADNKD